MQVVECRTSIHTKVKNTLFNFNNSDLERLSQKLTNNNSDKNFDLEFQFFFFLLYKRPVRPGRV